MDTCNKSVAGMHVSTFYFYLLKQIFSNLLSTFQKVQNFKTTFTLQKVEFLANTSTFEKLTKSSTFDNTAYKCRTQNYDLRPKNKNVAM